MAMKLRFTGLFLFACLLMLPAAAYCQALPGDSLYQTPLVLRDQQGKRFSLLSMRGRPVIVSMFYGSCTSVCPLTIEMVDRLRRAATVPGHTTLSILMISFDPKHDRVAKLAEVMRMHRLDASYWRLARTERGDTDAFAATLGVAYRARANGEFSHNAVIALLDENGRIVARTSETERFDPAFVDDLRRWSAGRR